MIDHDEMLELKRWNTPTIYNGWEQLTGRDAGRVGFNLEETHDFMPQMGSMVGAAVTVVIEPGNAAHAEQNPGAWSEYRQYVASVAGRKIGNVQDLGKPATYGALWGEATGSRHCARGGGGGVAALLQHVRFRFRRDVRGRRRVEGERSVRAG